MAEYPNQPFLIDTNAEAVERILKLSKQAPAGHNILKACLEITEMLLEKNVAYGNSALNPIRIFSDADDMEQLNVRIDDKLNRIANAQGYPGDNDIDDMIGYLVLLKIAKDKK